MVEGVGEREGFYTPLAETWTLILPPWMLTSPLSAHVIPLPATFTACVKYHCLVHTSPLHTQHFASSSSSFSSQLLPPFLCHNLERPNLMIQLLVFRAINWYLSFFQPEKEVNVIIIWRFFLIWFWFTFFLQYKFYNRLDSSSEINYIMKYLILTTRS